MSESAPEGTQNEQHEGGSTSGYTPPATQQDLNRIITERVNRAKATFGDYEDLKGKAAKFDALEASNLTENEKTANRLSAADAEVAKVPAKVAEALRAHLVTLHSIEADDAELFLTANDPALLLKQVERLVGRAGESKKRGNHVPREGSTTHSAESDERETARAIFGSN